MNTYTWKETIHGDEIESTVERAAEPHLGFIYTYRNLSAGGERRPWPGGSRESLTEELLRLAEEVERVRGIASFHASARNGSETLIRELREEVERLKAETIHARATAYPAGEMGERARIRRELYLTWNRLPHIELRDRKDFLIAELDRICPE